MTTFTKIWCPLLPQEFSGSSVNQSRRRQIERGKGAKQKDMQREKTQRIRGSRKKKGRYFLCLQTDSPKCMNAAVNISRGLKQNEMKFLCHNEIATKIQSAGLKNLITYFAYQALHSKYLNIFFNSWKLCMTCSVFVFETPIKKFRYVKYLLKSPSVPDTKLESRPLIFLS